MSEHDKRAAAERLREFGPKPVAPPEPPQPSEEELTERERDMQRLADLVLEHEKGKTTFYHGMKMAFGAALRDMGRAVEAGQIAGRLGISSPITSSVMGVGEGSGVIQDRVRFVEAVLAQFGKRYRAVGFIDKDHFESPTGV
jgi:hypothetical protein